MVRILYWFISNHHNSRQNEGLLVRKAIEPLFVKDRYNICLCPSRFKDYCPIDFFTSLTSLIFQTFYTISSKQKRIHRDGAKLVICNCAMINYEKTMSRDDFFHPLIFLRMEGFSYFFLRRIKDHESVVLLAEGALLTKILENGKSVEYSFFNSAKNDFKGSLQICQ